MGTLLIRLAGPLQSWGSDSKYDMRRTDLLPTKSGVTGMLAAALGRERYDPIDDLVSLKFGVRVDYKGRILDDFQVTEMNDELGKSYNSNISHRQYISDAIFLAGFESNDTDFLEHISYAVQHPVFPLFLGRRSCPPTLPIVIGVRDENLDIALQNEPWLISEENRRLRNLDYTLRIVVESAKEGYAVKRDVPVSFSSSKREYRYRYMKEMEPKIIENTRITTRFSKETEHDPFQELR